MFSLGSVSVALRGGVDSEAGWYIAGFKQMKWTIYHFREFWQSWKSNHQSPKYTYFLFLSLEKANNIHGNTLDTSCTGAHALIGDLLDVHSWHQLHHCSTSFLFLGQLMYVLIYSSVFFTPIWSPVGELCKPVMTSGTREAGKANCNLLCTPLPCTSSHLLYSTPSTRDVFVGSRAFEV